MAQEKPTKIFISYRREDTRLEADNIFLRLQKAFGAEAVFKDDGVINPGDQWEDKILNHLENAVVVLALIGNNFLCKRDGRLRLEEEGDWVRRELEYGLQSEGITVIPLLVDREQLPAAEALENAPVIQKLLMERQAYGTIRAESMERDLYKLIHKDLPALGVLPLKPADTNLRAVNRKVVKETAALNFWQRLFFSFLSKAKKQGLAFEALQLFDNNEISHFCDTLSGYLTLYYKDSNGRLLDFSRSFYSILNQKRGSGRFYLLLGETGSGKSTALAHLFTLFTVGRSNYKAVFAQFHKDLRPIYDLEDKENTILLLDGIDEAGEALRNPKGFFSTVENAAKDFAKVVISCRTQFFENQAAERKETDTEPRNFYNKAYLEFLSPDTVKAYVSKAFPITRENKKYRLALSIADHSGGHFTRPLLLPYINEMVEHSGRFLFFDGNRSGREVAITSYEIYDVVIHNWIAREKSRIKREQAKKNASGEGYGQALWETSLSIAQFLYGKEQKEGAQYILFVDLKWLPQRLN
ncbi:MAG: toll/interleukin-1 receptor domain-containing protein, partial [Phaeodactylibacter sp.]|nr:toll/interleukin-1 receptor domain-containing protein [Phaeodactylibacter sp.]